MQKDKKKTRYMDDPTKNRKKDTNKDKKEKQNKTKENR